MQPNPQYFLHCLAQLILTTLEIKLEYHHQQLYTLALSTYTKTKKSRRI